MLLRKSQVLSALNKSQWWSLQEMREYQLKKLRSIIQHAWSTVPYYQKLFKKNGILPEDIKTLNDLKKIPISSRDDIKNINLSERISSKYNLGSLAIHKTGGSTGQCLKIPSDIQNEDFRVANIFRTYFAHGYKPTNKIAVVQFYDIKPTIINKMGFFRRYPIPYHITLDEQIRLLQKINPQIIEGYPSRLVKLASEIGKRKLNGIKPEMVISNSELLLTEMRNQIQQGFNVNPVNMYDSWEFGSIGWECSLHSGLHINSESIYVEVLKNNEDVKSGEAGEIVITGFNNFASPLIRYAIGDVGQSSKGACDCGRGLPLLAKLVGRKGDYLIQADGSKIQPVSGISAICASLFEGIKEYQAIQKLEGEIQLKLVMHKPLDAQKKRKIRALFHKNFSLNRVSIGEEKSLNKTRSQKHQIFISELNKNYQNPIA